MCNCSPIPANICNQCAQGYSCGCPPDYTVLPKPTACLCCPTGYTWVVNAAFPEGICAADDKNHIPFGPYTPGVDCNPCAETMSASCVILPAIPCLLFTGGTLADFINYMCSEAYIQTILTTIGLSPTLQSSLCAISSTCPPVGSTTPIIGPITGTLP